jgi:2,4-dienoyl-CoA reductase (NADPH2)
MLQELGRRGVETRTRARVLEITEAAVRIEVDGRTEELPADAVVLAVGARPHDPVQALARERGIPLRVVGDARRVGTALDAIHQGFLAGDGIEGDALVREGTPAAA